MRKTDHYGHLVCENCGGVGYESCICPPADDRRDDVGSLIESPLRDNGRGVYYTDDMKYSAKKLGEGRWAVMVFDQGWELYEGMSDLADCQRKVDSLIVEGLLGV